MALGENPTLTTFKYSPDAMSQFKTFEETTRGMPEWLQKEIFRNQFPDDSKTEAQSYVDAILKLREDSNDPVKRAQLLKDQLFFQNQQMRAAAPYKLLFDLPSQIMNAFAIPGQIRLAGAQAAANSIVQGANAAAATQTPFSYQRPNFQYFS